MKFISDGQGMLNFTSTDGHVTGTLDIGSGYVCIYSWSSDRLGSGVYALEELRKKFRKRHIRAIGIGRIDEPNTEYFKYWLKAAEYGLIDSAEDDEGVEVKFPRKTKKFRTL